MLFEFPPTIDRTENQAARQREQAVTQSHNPVVGMHCKPRDVSDRFALGFTKVLRCFADLCFARRYGRRAVVLETVAGGTRRGRRPAPVVAVFLVNQEHPDIAPVYYLMAGDPRSLIGAITWRRAPGQMGV